MAASARIGTAYVLEWVSVASDPGLDNDELKMRPRSLKSVDGKMYQAILVMLKAGGDKVEPISLSVSKHKRSTRAREY